MKFDIKSALNNILQFLTPLLFTEPKSSVGYDPPYIELTVGDLKLDIINTFISADVTKRGGGVYEFSMELFDPTFLMEQIFLRTNVPVTFTYGNKNGKVTYKGKIFRTKATVKLSQGVTMSVQGFFSQSSYLDNTPRSYPASEFQGSTLQILQKLCDDTGMKLAVRDDVEDFKVIDGQGKPEDVISDASESTVQFIDSMTKKLGPSIGFNIVPANEFDIIDPKDTLLIYNQNNSALALSDNINKIVADLNHQDSNVQSYDFDIQQVQFEKYGGTEQYVTMDQDTNEIITTTSGTDDNNNKGDDVMQDLSDTAKSAFRFMTGSSVTRLEANQQLTTRTMKKLQAMYQVTLELLEGVPKAQPFLTQLEINSWITSHTNKTGMIKHHTSGDYMITQLVDHITQGTLTTTIVAQRAPGVIAEPETVDQTYDQTPKGKTAESLPKETTDEKSLDKLNRIHPDMKKVFYRAAELCPFDVIVTCGLRSQKQQQSLYAQGRTKPGPIVTQVDGVSKKSNHQAKADGLGYAIDLAPVIGGKINWKDETKFREIATYMKLASEELKIPITWGGDFKSFVDLPHYELKKKK